MPDDPLQSLFCLAPIVNLVIAGLVLLVGEARSERFAPRGWMSGFSLFAIALSFAETLLIGSRLAGGSLDVFSSTGSVDSLSLFLSAAVLLLAAVVALVSRESLTRRAAERGEYWALFSFATAGALVMVATSHLFTLVLGLEVMSLSLYALAGYFRTEARSVEASLKYFLVGSFASGFLLFGLALILAGSGSLDLRAVADAFDSPRPGGGDTLLFLGSGLLLVGFFFKTAAVPFHMWAPDVYEGAPSPVTVLMATSVKVAAVGAFLRVLTVGLSPGGEAFGGVLFAVAVATMVGGNLLALAQSRLKRLLAYSSVAHVGYLLVGFAATGAGSATAPAAVLYALVAYAVASAGAFSVVSFLEEARGSALSIHDLHGLVRRYPLLAAALAIFVLSLAGMPPLFGFLGKFYVFGAALESGVNSGQGDLVTLAVVGIATSLAGLGYYLRILVAAFMKEPDGSASDFRRFRGGFAAAVAASAFFTVWFGLGPALPFFGVSDLWDAAVGAIAALR